jgi:hypothetical protein
MFQMLGVFAEFEREVIRERAKAVDRPCRHDIEPPPVDFLEHAPETGPLSPSIGAADAGVLKNRGHCKTCSKRWANSMRKVLTCTCIARVSTPDFRRVDHTPYGGTYRSVMKRSLTL